MSNANFANWIGSLTASTSWLSSFPVADEIHSGVFTYWSPWDEMETRGSYLRRYGHINEGYHDQDPSQRKYSDYFLSNGTRAPSHVTAGQLRPILTALGRHPSNPFNLASPATYSASLQDGQDCLEVEIGGRTAYEEVILPMQLRLLGGPTPAPWPVIPSPPHPTPQPPIVPPAPAGGLPPLTPAAARVKEIEGIVLQFYLHSWVAIPGISSYVIASILIAARPMTTACLICWRQARKTASGDPRPLPPGEGA